jgi:excisionase family DNA binding protein
MQKSVLTAKEAAEILRIPVSTLFLICRRGSLRTFRAGRHLRIRRGALDEFVRQQERSPLEGELR